MNEWTVSTCPRRTPYSSAIAFSGGTIALVVQDAQDRIRSSGLMVSWLTPCTMFGTSPLPGAVSTTLSMPGRRCSDSPSRSRHLPVLSMRMASLMPYAV
ncbi:hypothetical protein SALBM311S_07344 [Streptomyces alboniger]